MAHDDSLDVSADKVGTAVASNLQDQVRDRFLALVAADKRIGEQSAASLTKLFRKSGSPQRAVILKAVIEAPGEINGDTAKT